MHTCKLQTNETPPKPSRRGTDKALGRSRSLASPPPVLYEEDSQVALAAMWLLLKLFQPGEFLHGDSRPVICWRATLQQVPTVGVQ